MWLLKSTLSLTFSIHWLYNNVHIYPELPLKDCLSLIFSISNIVLRSNLAVTECQLNSNEIPVWQWPLKPTVSKPYLSLDFSAPQSYSCIFHFQSKITRHNLFCPLSADMFKARGPDMIQGPVFTCNGHKVNLCSPALKVMYSCDFVGKSENKYWRCIVLHCQPRFSLRCSWVRVRGRQIKCHVYFEGLFTSLGATESYSIKNTVKSIIIKEFPIIPEGQTNLPGRRTIYKCSWEWKR